MSIIDLLSLPSMLVALTKDGFLLAWAANSDNKNSDTQDIPFMQNDFQFKVTTYQPLSLHIFNEYLLVVSEREVKQISLSSLEQQVKRLKTHHIKQEFATRVIKEQEGIASAIVLYNDRGYDSGEMMDQQYQNMNNSNDAQIVHKSIFIWATKGGKVSSSTDKFQQSSTICSITSTQSGHSLGNHEFATSLVPFRDGTLLLIGTSWGRVIIISLIGNKIVDDITTKHNLKFSSVNKIVMGIGNHKFFTIHDNQIVEWSMEIQKCLGSYYYTCPYSVLMTQNLSKDCSRLLISGGSRYIQIIDPNNPREKTQLETSLESVHVMKEYNGSIYCGGSFGMIEVIKSGITRSILFKGQNIRF